MQELDVVILGGGLAGLTLALQLKRDRPETSVIVVERRGAAAPEAAFKVGESVPLPLAHYMRGLGLGDHLESEQLAKLSVRFFMPYGDNSDIARRVELGPSRSYAVSGFQVDRGRLENHMVQLVRQRGVTVLQGGVVRELTFGRRQHYFLVETPSWRLELACRWVVDASGRVGLLRRRLGLEQSVGHNANAVWFRLADKVDLSQWSDNPDWRSRGAGPRRYLSTNHLMGRGYWVWLIPLASGSTSVGIVADPRYHPFEKMATFDRALGWLREYEPKCAAEVEERRGLLQDFKVMRDFAYGTKRFISPERWALTGEAAVFTDPLYSPGGDFINIPNTLIGDVILRDLGGESRLDQRIEAYERTLQTLFSGDLKIYEGRYGAMGHAEAWIAKVIWDTAFYWASYAAFVMHGYYGEPDFMRAVASDLYRLLKLDAALQDFFVDWTEMDDRQWSDAYIDTSNSFMRRLNSGMAAGLDKAALAARFEADVAELERLAAAIFSRAFCALGLVPEDGRLDPYTASLRRSRPSDSSSETEDLLSPAVVAEYAWMWPALTRRTESAPAGAA